MNSFYTEIFNNTNCLYEELKSNCILLYYYI